MKPLLLGALSASLALAGCATLSKDECLTVNWFEIGQSDGASGRDLSYLSNHREACASHGVAVNPDLYSAGRNQGLLQYCRPSVGYNRGENGSQYNGVCPEHLESGFLRGYQEGREVYLVQQQINQLRSQQDYQQRQQRELADKLEKKEQQLLSDGISSKKRRKLYDEISRLKDDLWQVKQPDYRLQSELKQLQLQKKGLLDQRTVF